MGRQPRWPALVIPATVRDLSGLLAASRAALQQQTDINWDVQHVVNLIFAALTADGAALDHGSLGGLVPDDDHTQYILVAGTRAFTGPQSMGGFKLINLAAASVNGDALRWEQRLHVLLDGAYHTDTAAGTVVRGDIITGQAASPKWTRKAISVPAATFRNYFGSANGDVEPDYKALFDATVPGTIAPGAAAATGSAEVSARRDHIHGAPATWAPGAHTHSHDTELTGVSADDHHARDHAATHGPAAADPLKLDDCAAPDDNTDLDATTTAHGLAVKPVAPAAGFQNVPGIANAETAWSNKALFDNTNPAATGTAAPGTSLIAARRDHVHAAPVGTGAGYVQGLRAYAGTVSNAAATPTWTTAVSAFRVIGADQIPFTIGNGQWLIQVPAVSGATFSIRLYNATDLTTFATITGVAAAGWYQTTTITASAWPSNTTEDLRVDVTRTAGAAVNAIQVVVGDVLLKT